MTLKPFLSALAGLMLGTTISLALLPPAPAMAATGGVSIDIFFDQLAPYGSWVSMQGGYVFVPEGIAPDWRPYTVGHWALTDDYGWLWVSDEPFGWATYHYGRWAYSDEIGWYWVPGRRWAPAWVTWRRSDDQVFWAPSPPRDDPDLLFAIRIDVIPDDDWVVVPSREFLADRIDRVVIKDDRQRHDGLARSRRLGEAAVQNNAVVDTGIDVESVRQATGHQVPALRVERMDRPGELRAANGTVQVFQGELAAKPDAKPRTAENIDVLRKRHAQTAGKVGQNLDKATSSDQSGKTNAPAVTGQSSTSTKPMDTNGKPKENGTGQAQQPLNTQGHTGEGQASSGGRLPVGGATADELAKAKKMVKKTAPADQAAQPQGQTNLQSDTAGHGNAKSNVARKTLVPPGQDTPTTVGGQQPADQSGKPADQSSAQSSAKPKCDPVKAAC